jgi:acyl-CoA thioester hydrolase
MTDVSASKPFAWPVRVYYEDTDAQGVVYYANYFRFTERARTEWLRSLGIDQERLLREERRMFVVVSASAEFLQPARFNDQLVITAALADRSRASFDIEQRVHRDLIDGALLFRSTVKAAYLDADTLKPQRIPRDLFQE